MKTKKLVVLSLFAALICALTIFTRIPVSEKIIWHLGDSIIYVVAILIGGPFGAIACGIGSALSDYLMGYSVYIIPTFIIKALTCYVIYLTYKRFKYFSMAFGGIVTICGYFFTVWLLSGFQFAQVSALTDLLQVLFSIIVAILILKLNDKFNIFKDIT